MLGAIISRAESLEILNHDLLKAALERHAAELAKATAEDRPRMMGRIEQDIEAELRSRMRRAEPDSLIY